MATIRAVPGTGQNTDLSDEDRAALQADLGRLNKVASGLGDRAVRYVAGGTDTSALMEIKPSGRRQRRPPFWETTNPTKPTRSTRPCAGARSSICRSGGRPCCTLRRAARHQAGHRRSGRTRAGLSPAQNKSAYDGQPTLVHAAPSPYPTKCSLQLACVELLRVRLPKRAPPKMPARVRFDLAHVE